MPAHLYMIPQGGFGNVLFVYMCGYALAKRFGMRLFFISNYSDWRKKMHDYTTFRKCNFIELDQKFLNNCLQILEPEFNRFQHLDVQLDPNKNYVIKGFFQSYKYSEGYLPEIKRELFAEHPYLELVKEIYKAPASREAQTIAVHVRRTDYLKLGHVYNILDDKYYSRALTELTEKITESKIAALQQFRVLFFSDDVDFLRGWGLVKKYHGEIVNISDPEQTFLLMTLCDHFIAANSTFSVLAYLFRDNPDAHLYIPQKWFVSNDSGIDNLVPITELVHVI